MSKPRQLLIYKATHAEIPLKNGYVALVDLIDAEKVSSYRWVLDDTKPNWYVQTVTGKPRKTLKLHRYILNSPEGFVIDHINGNALDNRRSNLRVCKQNRNAANRRKIKIKSSRYKGVHRRENGKWRAAIRVNRKLINLGTFNVELDAAKAYNKAALKHFGEFACLNLLPY